MAADPRSLTGLALREVLAGRLPVPAAPEPRPAGARPGRDLTVLGAEQHNLKRIDVTIPRNTFTVITGVSGSGKTSLAFDTIFAEGQARYVESLSTYARRFLGRLDKARVDGIEGLAPAVAIDQKNSGRSPRSTLATVTELYDYLRLLYARVGVPHCPSCGRRLEGWSPTRLARELAETRAGERLILSAPLWRPGSQRPTSLDRPEHFPALAKSLVAEGFIRAHLDGEPVELGEWLASPAAQRALKPAPAIDLVVDRLTVSASHRKRLAEALEQAFERGRGLAKLLFPDAPAAGGERRERLVSEPVGCVACDFYQSEPLTPRMFSFNSHLGACPECAGLGRTAQVEPALLVPFPERPLFEGALVAGPLGQALARRNSQPERALRAFAEREGIDLGAPFGALPEAQRQALLFGDGRRLRFSRRRHFSHSYRTHETRFEGLTGIVQGWYNSPEREKWAPLIGPVLADTACPACAGERLKPEYRAVTLNGRSISRFCALTVGAALAELETWSLTAAERKVAEQSLQEIRSRLGFLADVGLAYLNLDREATTLSGGEAQRIRLASQLGSRLVGVIYVLDEPTIGLHPRDTGRLLATLGRLRDLGNTVLVVEHDLDTMRAADHVIDMGPGAGHRGGEVVAAGPPAALARQPRSLTGAYLAGRMAIALPERTRPVDWSRAIEVRGARANNLRRLTVRFPLGTFTAVTGVSGSGKSTLVVEVLQKALQRKLGGERVVPGAHDAVEGLALVDKLVVIDQSAIGKSPKSNPATYTGVLDGIRALMAQMPEAKLRGYAPGRFSFNVAGGRCEACEGRGMNHIEMHFLADVWVPCEVCGGRRYNRETLQVRFRGKHMAEMLELEIDEALELFANQRRIRRQLQTLSDVGLGYMKLGQPGHTLSGGEAQRVKLAAELGKPHTGRTLYILDEPTTGLHLDDTARLLQVLHRLVDAGNTVVVIEHNLDVIKTADHVIDLGPEGGDAGGRLVAEGTPAEVAAIEGSHTGRALLRVLGSPSPRALASA
ncbi:MAG: excinuclease ABC subunit UvrA [Candidatus Lambdaproteobacteria bacterium]|nr:excinuclease ABC subunit UvrA [Candidatus Lambdaproteobacteria bacterium]